MYVCVNDSPRQEVQCGTRKGGAGGKYRRAYLCQAFCGTCRGRARRLGQYDPYPITRKIRANVIWYIWLFATVMDSIVYIGGKQEKYPCQADVILRCSDVVSVPLLMSEIGRKGRMVQPQ